MLNACTPKLVVHMRFPVQQWSAGAGLLFPGGSGVSRTRKRESGSMMLVMVLTWYAPEHAGFCVPA